MSIKREFLKNTSYVTIAKIFENILSYIIIVLISRNLGAEGLGQYSFIFSFVGLFFIFADFGLIPLMIKDLSKNFAEVDKYVTNIFNIQFIMSVFVFIVYVVSIFLINKQNMLIPLIFVGLIQIINIVENVSTGLLRIKNQGWVIALINLFERIVAVVGVFFVLSTNKSLVGLISILLVSNFLKTVIRFIFAKKYFLLKIKNIDYSFSRKLLWQGFPFLLFGVFSLVYIQMDTIMLALLKNDVVVGWYTSGYKIINILNIIPGIILMFGFPLLSKLTSMNKKLLQQFLEKTNHFLLVIMFPITVGVWMLGDRVLEFIYQFNSVESFIAFKILIIAEIFVFLTQILGNCIATSDKQNVFAIIGGIGAFCNIILNFALIPKYSLYGAGIATGITYFIMFILMHIYVTKKIVNYNILHKIYAPILSSIVVFFLIKFLYSYHIVLIILISIAVYFSIIFILERKDIKKMLS
ncbi:flippase [Candidatus Woesearchaeota archaeon]|nr:flippase [Candidatus Woesearchaeota archaeon]